MLYEVYGSRDELEAIFSTMPSIVLNKRSALVSKSGPAGSSSVSRQLFAGRLFI
jgi:hypothetical protein